MADGLFLKHQVQVHFRDEWVSPDCPYRMIFCHIRRRDEARFIAAMEELPNKMLLCGHADYLDVCSKVWGTIQTELDGRRDLYGPERTAEQTQ